MQQVYSDIIQYRGKHYDFGYYQGSLLKNSFILPNRKKQWGPIKDRHFIIDHHRIKELLHHYAPGIWEELHGLADALKMNIQEAIQEFGGYYLEYGRSGCSIYTEAHYMVRNYDNAPSTYEGRYLMYQPTDVGYATIGPTMQITGRTDGMNEHGLVMGYNFINRKQSSDGFLCNMIGRIILESCRNVQEAINLLKEIPHRHTFSYVLLDIHGEKKVVEASPRAVVVQESSICTNHFQKLTNENRFRMDDSLRRYRAIEQQSVNVFNPYQAFQMFNRTEYGVFSTKYGAWAGTLHTALYLPKTKNAWFALGGNREPFMFDFDRWLQGRDTNFKRIKGVLSSSEVFVNMKYMA
ncbi:linear amide C-N hydrolase [Virgibacillus pantothenticus]|uniref:Choloylglycine hydrolase n=1 Tax=Virgibacillus pantothenticus TaxID=1473 RepID=A0A0L0QMZ1_VIRPA|nr:MULTISPECIES: C45 family peptidase [Virgibacillus]API93651.1 acyl-CoA--6-aminopenicillanic acid acyltransferase [Virgibacillus sp. 6R]KNE19941.1 choloylglycine hydrolase [Virgibacillus pantothenticus]MBS7429955.1 linear amide C-N hydrolase [Virgibacillus sp. 19R1-5]MED3736407.1 C45 family autoproteolytic acyltransferase/hydrolase [Virgibacillus pantothenticus]QTY18324.1 linear amide C-N hydrolase [Virgibacillus pantothenticus]